MKNNKPDYEIKQFSTPEAWEEWLSQMCETAPGVWLRFAKKNSGIATASFSEALEIALCYGWIDGQSKSLDEKFYLQKFTPRGPRSTWSKINREKVERLIKEKKMQPAGFTAIEAAKSDGRWERAYDSPSSMVMPDDFLERISHDKKAESFFKTLNKANTYAIGWRLQTAKKPETRERRMQVILQMLHEGKKIY